MELRAVVLAAWVLALSGATFGGPKDATRGADDAPTQSSPGSPMEKLRAAEKSGDETALAEALDEFWRSDPEKAEKASLMLLNKGTVSQRPLGVAALVRHAPAESLARAARTLNPNTFRHERRLLVRALGSRDGNESFDLAASFMRDNDRMVQAAVISAMGDMGEPRGLGHMVSGLPPMPTTQTPQDETYIIAMNSFGAARTIAGKDLPDANAVRQWWEAQSRSGAEDEEENEGVREDAEKGAVKSKEPDAQGRFQTRHFRVQFRLKDWKRVVRATDMTRWEQVVSGIDSAAEAALRGAEPMFGRMHLPVLDLVFADDQTIASEGGTTRGYYGFAIGPKIVMRFTDFEAARTVLAHELIHVIHSSMYERQPRWLSEGIANSLTLSQRRSIFTSELGMRVDPRAVELITCGRGVTSALNWTDSGETGSDRHWYDLSHMVVDYLRFGGFAESETRLALLAGRLARGETGTNVVPQIWGRSLKELDRGLQEWLEGNSKQAGPGTDRR